MPFGLYGRALQRHRVDHRAHRGLIVLEGRRVYSALLDEVLGAIDPAAFEDKKTPVCSVVYTVALQSPPV